MACPLLCRADPCLEGVMVQGENGYTFQDAAGFHYGLEAISSSEEWRNKAGCRSEEIAAAFGIEAFGDSVEEVYESVMVGGKV